MLTFSKWIGSVKKEFSIAIGKTKNSMATIHVDANFPIYHQELRILSSAFWFFFSTKNAHRLGEHFLNVDKLLFYIKRLDTFQKMTYIYSHLRRLKTFRCEKSSWNTSVSGTREFWNLRSKTNWTRAADCVKKISSPRIKRFCVKLPILTLSADALCILI